VDQEFNAADLSLREAIREANSRPGIDTITFAANLSGQTISLLLGQLQITEGLTIRGLGADQTILQANPAPGDHRIFDVTQSAGDVTLEALSLTGGHTSADREPNDLTFPSSGAAIRFLPNATLTIRNSVISDNRTGFNLIFPTTVPGTGPGPRRAIWSASGS
jgi:hypothetical protein